MISFKGCHFPKEVILWSIRWYVAYPLAYRMLEEMLSERGIKVDHATIQRWVSKFSAKLLHSFKRYKRSVGQSWRMDETYIKVKGKWVYLYRAVDKTGNTVDFLLQENRDEAAARRFFDQAIENNGTPSVINMDKSGANKAAMDSYNRDHKTSDDDMGIQIRQIKYLNNLIEQDHRFIKRKTRPMLGFKSFESAKHTLMGIELAHMIRKGQMQDSEQLSVAEQFYLLAA